MKNKLFSIGTTMHHVAAAMVLLLVLVGSLMLTGCASHKTPPEVYYNMSNWYVRQNATPKYAVPFDIFYAFPKAFQGHEIDPFDIEFAEAQTVRKFGNKARVFAPVCRNTEEYKAAFKWYLSQYHGKNDRPVVFIGEKEGAKLLSPIEKEARKHGLIYTVFRFEDSEEELVSPQVIDEVSEAVNAYRFERGWKTQESYE